MSPKARAVMKDLVIMIENEIQRVRTGYAPGVPMRDCWRQWESVVKDAKELLEWEE